MKISFAGHSKIPSSGEIKKLVKELIRNHIENEKQITCYLGGYGDFDAICACVCRELKTEYVNMELVYVMPYIHISEQVKVKEMIDLGFYDRSVYPPVENTPPKFAILKRNEWMMVNADIIIAYVQHRYGGVYKSLQVANRKKKKVINIYDLLSNKASKE